LLATACVKAMARQMDEDVLERRFTESNRFDFVTEPVDDLAHELMTAREFDPDCAVDQRAPHTHLLKDLLTQ
jgi:hypothetical protein